MKNLVVTGGIACGKSRVSDLLLGLEPLRFHRFDSDQAAHDLLNEAANQEQIVAQFGVEVLRDGVLDREALGQLAFADEGKRRWLEELIHPQIRARRSLWQEELARNPAVAEDHWTLLEIPLWFEAGVTWPADRVLVVGCSVTTQRERLRRDRGLDDERIELILKAQWPLQRKLPQADLVCWNDGSEASLVAQTQVLRELLFG